MAVLQDAVRVTIIEADGSSPREAGACMVVSVDGSTGTIGGGALEHQAIARARAMLGEQPGSEWQRHTEKIALGPSLGQCCGGAVRLLYERIGAGRSGTLGCNKATSAFQPGLLVRPLASGPPPRLVLERRETQRLPPPVARAVAEMLSGLRPRRLALVRDWLIEPTGDRRPRFYLYGAGHVGRAIVAVAATLRIDIVWVDTARDRFPESLAGDIHIEIAADPAIAAGRAEANCYHLVMTYSHAIDLAVCHALLQRNDFAFLGLIGSKTKRARFLSRLRQAGIADAALQRLTSPIGIGGITGKEPATIAVAAVAQLLQLIEASRQMKRPEATEASAS